MKLGVISDIHSNRVALEAVLDDMPDVDSLVCAGDVVGYNPWPAECLEIVRENCDAVVKGNHDRTYPTPGQYRANRMAHAGLKHTKEQLNDEQKAWLDDRPDRELVAGDDVLLVHSHPDPAKQGTYVYPKDFARMRPVLREQYDDRPGAVILGHTHIAHKAVIDGKLILNPGSVGQPRDGDPRAAYAVVDTEEMEADIHRVGYDIQEVKRAIDNAGLPAGTGERLGKAE